jgi:hypothetical protein
MDGTPSWYVAVVTSSHSLCDLSCVKPLTHAQPCFACVWRLGGCGQITVTLTHSALIWQIAHLARQLSCPNGACIRLGLHGCAAAVVVCRRAFQRALGALRQVVTQSVRWHLKCLLCLLSFCTASIRLCACLCKARVESHTHSQGQVPIYRGPPAKG